MIRNEVPVTVIESDDPLITLHITQTDENGVTTNYDFTGVAELAFIVKSGVSDETAIKTYTMTGGDITVGTPATSGKASVQLAAADLGATAVKRYKFRARRGTRWDTLMAGPFIIQNT